MNINLHIDRLVLDGLPIDHQDGPRVKAAIEVELSRLLSANGLANSLLAGGATPSVPAPGIQMSSDGNPARLGRKIARAIYGGIGK
jgi:hypothetical protein